MLHFRKKTCNGLHLGTVIKFFKRLILLIFLIFLGILIVIYKYSGSMPEKKVSYIIVLGAKVNGRMPSESLKSRLDACYDYYTIEDEGDMMIVVSGGKGDDEEISEAEASKNYLVSLGINPDKIILEDKSVNTFENIKNSLKLIDKSKGFAIVSNSYHLFRAKMTAKYLGADAELISARTPSSILLVSYLREVLSVIYMFIRFALGYIGINI